MSAIKALLLTAQLAGVTPLDIQTTALKSPTGPADVQPLIQVPLSAVAAGNARATAFRTLDGKRIAFSLSLGPDGYLWLRASREDAHRNLRFADLLNGMDVELAGDGYRFKLGPGLDVLRITSVSGEAARLSLQQLINHLYKLSVHVRLGPVVYSALYEDGALFPRAAGLLRRDRDGRFWVTYRRAQHMAGVYWFLAVNGTMYGLRIERGDLVFYSKPVGSSLVNSRETRVYPIR